MFRLLKGTDRARRPRCHLFAQLLDLATLDQHVHELPGRRPVTGVHTSAQLVDVAPLSQQPRQQVGCPIVAGIGAGPDHVDGTIDVTRFDKQTGQPMGRPTVTGIGARPQHVDSAIHITPFDKQTGQPVSHPTVTGIGARPQHVAEPTFPQFVAVPDPNPHFVGRTEELTLLNGTAGVPTVITQVATGMGGVGKTALAVEHCHRHRSETDVVRWLNAEERLALTTQYMGIGPAIGVDVTALEPVDAIARIRGWFETTEYSWLLVLDNVETPAALEQLIPSGGNGRVLVTTRHQDWTRAEAHSLQVGLLEPDDALALLMSTADPLPSTLPPFDNPAHEGLSDGLCKWRDLRVPDRVVGGEDHVDDDQGQGWSLGGGA